MKNDMFDIVIIGGGMAGMMAANSAHDKAPELKICVVVPEQHGSGGCSHKTHGINVSRLKEDSPKLHVKDTMIGGGDINSRELVEIMCENIPDIINSLEKDGMEFDQELDNSDEKNFGLYGGSSIARSMHKKDLTGRHIMNHLISNATNKNIFIYEDRWFLGLSKDKNSLICLNKRDEKIEKIYSKTFIFATGGGACVYPISTISDDKLATGMIIAHEIGLTLIDMEFIQFHPTGLVQPKSSGHGEIMEEEVRTKGGKLINKLGERFMYNYDSRGEGATRDIVARASFLEMLNSRGTDNGAVILDISSLDKKWFMKRFPHMVERLRNLGIDLLTENKIEISPSAHYIMGGIKINKIAQTEIKNIFACGEDAGGIDGANRLGGNGMAGTLVFGYIAGINAAKVALKIDKVEKNNCEFKVPYFNLSKKHYYTIDSKLKNIMWEHGGIVKNEKGIIRALSDIEKIEKEIEKKHISLNTEIDNEDIIYGRMFYQKILLSKIILKASLERKSNVGAHFRTDETKENYNYNINVVKHNNEIRINKVVK